MTRILPELTHMGLAATHTWHSLSTISEPTGNQRDIVSYIRRRKSEVTF